MEIAAPTAVPLVDMAIEPATEPIVDSSVAVNSTAPDP